MKKLYILFIALFFASSCDLLQIDEDLNKNPNSPSEATAEQLLANSMRSLPGISSNTTGQFMAQYLAETQYPNASQYPAGGTSFYGWYEGPLINLETILTEEFTVPTSENQYAVAKILKAYYFWFLTDRWGDLPYSEALQGTDIIAPAYDTQESIYEALFAILKEANTQIDESGSIPSDIIYNGDMSKWKKFANTLRMLMALRLSEVDAQSGIDAEAEFNAALTAGVMESNDDSFVYQHLANADNQNFWYGQVVESNRQWWGITETLFDIMNPVDDPRLPVFADTSRNGDYAGIPIGTEASEFNYLDYSLLGSDLLDQDQPVYLITYAQALFARAEAAQRSWTSESDATNYNAAIEASILQWTGSTDDVAAYTAQPEVAYDGTLEQLATQRYIHLFLNGYEGWAEWRRTGFPNLVPAATGANVPTRQSYSAEEALNNTENYETAIERQFNGENTLYGKVWWDAN
ncbi:SusD/RagB family nutrient-binding outer membrane lipoprotein [Gracilimonas tropica]|uniref:SusD/RagB family nutrient-binding outer membrane lipoprotein n=1 Tax=Gracilimonas tropica TaxID=454600 RepID=UPI0003725801|nr:SusD/RagB family nutrient-binding outer membrane lipoprotein [Gracilimonas tropica]